MEALQEQVLANPTDSTTDGEAAKWKPLGDAFRVRDGPPSRPRPPAP